MAGEIWEDNTKLNDEEYKKELLNQLAIIRNEELSIIVGGRTITDFNYWKEKGYLIVGIKVNEEVKKQRLIDRDGEITVKNSNSEHNTESDIPYIINNLCDEVIINDGTIEDLRNAAKNMLIKYNF